jgi:hypothetical protein
MPNQKTQDKDTRGPIRRLIEDESGSLRLPEPLPQALKDTADFFRPTLSLIAQEGQEGARLADVAPHPLAHGVAGAAEGAGGGADAVLRGLPGRSGNGRQSLDWGSESFHNREGTRETSGGMDFHQ